MGLIFGPNAVSNPLFRASSYTTRGGKRAAKLYVESFEVEIMLH